MELLLIIIIGLYLVALNRRVSALEKKIESTHTEAQPIVSPIPSMAQTMVPPIPAPATVPPPSFSPVSIPIPPPPVAPVVHEDAFVTWIKKDFFVKLGALLLLIAFGWFVSYAFANNWIGPWGRVIAGVLSGAAVFAFGAYRMRTQAEQGGIFVVLGSLVIIMSIWAARELYGFLTPLIALWLMVIPVVISAVLSVRYRLPSLALLSFVMGTVAPFFTAAPEPSLVGFSTYLLMLVAGTLWVGILIDALFLAPVALFVVTLWSFLFVGNVSSAELSKGLIFSFAFTVAFFASNIMSMITYHAEKIKTSHVLTGLGTGAYLYFWIAGASSGPFESFLYAAWMALFILAGFFVFKRTGNTVGLYLYGAVGLSYLVALTASLFSGMALTMIYAAELALLIVSTRFVSVERRARQVLSWLYVPLCLVALQHVFSNNWVDSVLHRDFAALLIVTASLVVSAVSLRRGSEEQQHLQASAALFVTAGGFVAMLVWLILHALLAETLATTLFTIAASIIGTILYTAGIRFKSDLVRTSGSFLSFFYLVLIAYSFIYIGAVTWTEGVFHMDAAVTLAITASFWLAAAILEQKHVVAVSTLPLRVATSAAGLYTLTFMWLVLHGLLSDGLATTISLIIYTITGLALFVYGRLKDESFIKLWGGVLLCGVVLRLLFVEIWALTLTMRIITFFIVGILLISTAFIGRKKE